MFKKSHDFSLGKLLSALAPLLILLIAGPVFGSEADLKLPSLTGNYQVFGIGMTGHQMLWGGVGVCILGLLFGLYEVELHEF